MKTKMGICVWCIPAQGIEKAVQWASENGLQGIEVDLGEEKEFYPLSQPEVQSQYVELGKKWNISYPSLGVNALCQFGMSSSSDHPKAKAALEKAVMTAQALKIPLLQLPSFVNGEINSEEGFQNTVDCLRYVCRLAEGTGILVGSESALSTEDQLRLIKEVNHPQFRIYFDTRNPFIKHGCDVAGMLNQVYSHVAEVHLKDGVDAGPSTLLAKGNSGFLHTLDVLIRHQYSDWLVMENDYQQIAFASGISPEDALKRDIDTVLQKLV